MKTTECIYCHASFIPIGKLQVMNRICESCLEERGIIITKSNKEEKQND